MKEKPPVEEVESQVDRQPSKPASAAEIPLWFVTSLVLGFASLVSLVYYFFFKRSGKSHAARPQPVQLQSPEQAPQSALDIIRGNPAFSAADEKPSAPQPLSAFNRERMRPFIAPLVALVIAYLAQGVFDSTTNNGLFRSWEWLVFLPEATRQWMGAAMYLIAVLVWVFAAPPMPFVESRPNQPGVPAPERSSPFRSYAFVGAIVVYFIAVVVFLNAGENGFVRVMWGVGVTLFVLSQLPSKISHPQAEESPRFQWNHWLILVLILVVGFWLRFYQVATIPDDFHGDMASHGWVARDFILGTRQEIFGFGWTATPTIGFLPAYLTMQVFGNNIFGMQMAAVIGGTFSLFAIYLLVWRLFDSHRLAALTTTLIAINVAHIHFSRIFNMEPWPFSNFAIFLLIDGLRSRRSASFGLAGVFIGFSMLMYTSGRALPFMFTIFLIYALIFQRAWVIQNWRGLVLVVVGVILTMGPSLVYYLKYWDLFVQRSRDVFIFVDGAMAHSLYKYNTDSPLVVMWHQVKLSLLMFNQTGDTSTQFGFPYPMFNSLISPLLVLGLGFAIRHWKKASMAFTLIWLVVVTVLGSILTIDAPFWPRLVGILPAAALLIAISFEQMIELAKKAFGVHKPLLLLGAVVLMFAVVGYQNWNRYYLFVKDSGSPSTLTGRYIGQLPLGVTACGVTDPQLNVRETSFLAWPHTLIDIAPDAPDAELDRCVGDAIVWAISPENISRLDAIRARWPHGILDQHYMPRRDYTMTFYLVNVAPPDSHAENTPVFSVWLFDIASIVLSLVISALLVWFIARSPILKNLRDRQVKETALPPMPVIEGGHTLENQKNKAYPEIDGWFQKGIAAFDFPKPTFKLVVSILLPLLAVALAYFAQTFLDLMPDAGAVLGIKALYFTPEGERQAIAVLGFLTAALLWTLSTTASGTTPDADSHAQGGRPLQPLLGSPAQAVGIFLTLGATFLYAFMDETALTRWLWLAGVVFFIASLFFRGRSDSVFLQEESPRFSWRHFLALVFLLVAAFYLRVYRLYDIPLDLSTDMASVGINARDYLMGVEKRIFGTGWYYYPRFVFLPYTFSMWLAGNNLYGLNFGTVIFGTLHVLGTYLFVWRLFDRHRLALLTAVILAANPAHIQFSRIPSYVDPWSIGFFALFFFVDGLKGRRWASLALSGLLTGFAITSYPSGRAIIPMLAVALAAVWLFKRKWITDNYIGFLWMFLGGLVSLGPNLVYFIRDWEVYMQRSREVIIFNPGVVSHLKYTYEVDSIWMIIWEQVRRSFLQFNYYADRSAQFFYPYPMFNSLVSPLLWLGFGMSLYRWKKPEFLLSFSSFLIILVMGSILTNDAPTWVRLVGIITFAALFIALALDEFALLLERFSLKPFISLWLLGMILLLGSLTLADWNAYLGYVGNEDLVRPEIHVGRYLDTLPDDIDACGITFEHDYLVSQEEIQFLGWPRSIKIVPYAAAPLTPELCPYEKNVVWILSPIYEDRLAEIQALWPGGTLERRLTKNQWHVFTSYLVLDQNQP